MDGTQNVWNRCSRAVASVVRFGWCCINLVLIMWRMEFGSSVGRCIVLFWNFDVVWFDGNGNDEEETWSIIGGDSVFDRRNCLDSFLGDDGCRLGSAISTNTTIIMIIIPNNKILFVPCSLFHFHCCLEIRRKIDFWMFLLFLLLFLLFCVVVVVIGLVVDEQESVRVVEILLVVSLYSNVWFALEGRNMIMMMMLMDQGCYNNTIWTLKYCFKIGMKEKSFRL